MQLSRNKSFRARRPVLLMSRWALDVNLRLWHAAAPQMSGFWYCGPSAAVERPPWRGILHGLGDESETTPTTKHSSINTERKPRGLPPTRRKFQADESDCGYTAVHHRDTETLSTTTRDNLEILFNLTGIWSVRNQSIWRKTTHAQGEHVNPHQKNSSIVLL